MAAKSEGLNSIDDNSNSSSSSDADNDEEFVDINIDPSIVNKNLKLKNYIEVIALYDDAEFKSEFHMERSTFNFILQILHPVLSNMPDDLVITSIKKQVFIAIWMLANPNSYNTVSVKFNIGKTTAWTILRRVVNALYNVRSIFIKWPTAKECEESQKKIQEEYGIPGAIGVMDRTLIKILPPEDNPQSYICNKTDYTVQLQIVCDADMQFIHCYAGQPGSMLSMWTFKYSGVQQKCNDEFFPDNSYIIGSTMYAIQRHVIVPYKDDGSLTCAQTAFNAKLLATQTIAQKAIALLKGRWRCLLDQMPTKQVDFVSRYITACCVLHNICISKDDKFNIPILVEREAAINFPSNVNNHLEEAGISKRETLTRLLMNIN